MQRLVETPKSNAHKQRSQLIGVGVCIILATWVAFVILPGLDVDSNNAPKDAATPETLAPAVPSQAKSVTSAEAAAKTRADGATTAVAVVPAHGEPTAAAVDILTPWGYNANRNVARWKAIYQSMRGDLPAHHGRFSLVDYGADAGYFSISAGHAFPEAMVIAVELGGSGGVIWGKTQEPVHTTQDKKMTEHQVNNVMMCQTRVSHHQFADFNTAKQMHTYQFVLSVFHWFPLGSRQEFEEVVVQLFMNARTTFIEMPTIGDKSRLIQKQVGYELWSKWYDGRTDVGEILQAALKGKRMRGKVQLVASLPWLKWSRNVYRVDLSASLDSNDDFFARRSFSCAEHRRLLKCNQSLTLRQECHDVSP